MRKLPMKRHERPPNGSRPPRGGLLTTDSFRGRGNWKRRWTA